MKTILSLALVLASFSAPAFAQDCFDFTGSYQLVAGSETTNFCEYGNPNPAAGNSISAEPTNCFAFAADMIQLSQDSCSSVTMTVANGFGSTTLTLSPNGNGSAVEGQDESFFRIFTTTLNPSQNAGEIEMTYTQKTTFLGSLAYPYEYHARFRKAN